MVQGLVMASEKPTSSNGLSHVDATGAARMVDVGEKPISRRTATATVVCRMQAETSERIRQNTLKKGDVLSVARVAAIQAAKRTDELIPLCHSLPLDGVTVDFQWLGQKRLKISVTVSVTGRTGVEMEAMVGASIAGLTVYDMCKAVDRSMSLEEVSLESKSGGTRGDYRRDASTEQ
jgi:cyclic pyranopterin monophosphate synthase